LTWFTVTVTVCTTGSTPSVAVKSIAYDPSCVKSGVKLNVPVLLPLSTNEALVGRPVALRVSAWPSASEAESRMARDCPSSMVVSACGSQTGAWFVLVTVTVTASGVMSVPSSALKVIGYEPD